MSQPHRFQIAPAAGIAAFAVLALLLAATAVPVADDAPTAAATPSYASLRPLLQQGEGKGLDEGGIELWQIHYPKPTGWVWVSEDAETGNLVETWAFSVHFIHPDPQGGPEIDYVLQPECDPESQLEFVAWIIDNNDHIDSPDDLDIEVRVGAGSGGK